jgi:hypothetical protein
MDGGDYTKGMLLGCRVVVSLQQIVRLIWSNALLAKHTVRTEQHASYTAR